MKSNTIIGDLLRDIVLPLFTCFCIIASSVISPLVMQAIEIETADAGSPLPEAAVIQAKAPELHDIFFERGSADIRTDAEPVLLENAHILRQNPKAYVVIEGYCSYGEEEMNGLAQIRADQVKEYMVSEGVDPDKVITVGKCTENLMQQTPEERETYPELDQRVHFSSLDKYEDNDLFFG